MASSTNEVVMGQFMHPIINHDTKESDPWKRNHFQPPPLGKLVPRSYPLTDIRPVYSSPAYSVEGLLQSHGFAVLSHCSEFLKGRDQKLTEHAVTEVYHPEIRDLILKITGAKSLFFTTTVFRQGQPAREKVKLATDGDKPSAAQKLTNRSDLTMSKPIRMPHMDSTPLAARQLIRSQARDIYDAAARSGVISSEDNICNPFNLKATSKEATSKIAQHYNSEHGLGPRYATYSVWRPLRRVERDPIACCPRKETSAKPSHDTVYWTYETKVPGAADLGGDYVREYAVLGVAQDQPLGTADPDPLTWYYLSNQEPDEVLLIKLFDSASLGPHAHHASAPWHGSPDIGSMGGDLPRESIEVRVLVFW